MVSPYSKTQPKSPIAKEQSLIATVVDDVCRHIALHVDEPLPLAQLALKAGYSAAHLHKAFTARIGLSPKAYQAGLRRQRLKQELRQDSNLAGAIYGAGYGSTSRVYSQLDRQIGMTPKEYRRQGLGLVLYYAVLPTPAGMLLLAAGERGICLLAFMDGEDEAENTLAKEFPHAQYQPMPANSQGEFTKWSLAINRFLTEQAPLKDLPLDIRGTALQLAVWRYIETIPTGRVCSYQQVACAIGRPKAVRAVARACGQNRLALAIPCHRVLRGNGELAGYRWGIARKAQLLAQEGVETANKAAISALMAQTHPELA
jgi:AraC family transcriptional regulator, regulatory protein of adaptative response / methylated-DNA-[protein]-cysteine methyltransferase